jgi:hypothetical protein
VLKVGDREFCEEFDEGKFGLSAVSLKDVKSRKLRWLWKNRIPRGGLTLHTGKSATGKSLVLVDLAARITRGDELPDGAPCEAGNILIYTLEENPEAVLRPRLVAAGADQTRVRIVRPARPNGNGDRPKMARLPEGIKHVREFVERYQPALTWFDPLSDFLDPKLDLNSEVDARAALEPLNALAQEKDIAIIAVRHLNKRSDAAAMDRAMGSTGFINFVRTALLVEQRGPEDAMRALACMKNNVGPKAPMLGFRVSPQASGVATVEWTGPIEGDADDLLAGVSESAGGKLAEACDFLKRELKLGRVSSKTVRDHAISLNISEKTLKRARKELGVIADEERDHETKEIRG